MGLAFSIADFNPWHPTARRSADAGHGINASFDNTRDPANEFREILAGDNDVMNPYRQSEAEGGHQSLGDARADHADDDVHRELLEDLVMAGVNKALEEASGLAKQEMAKAAGGLIPPGTDLSQFGL